MNSATMILACLVATIMEPPATDDVPDVQRLIELVRELRAPIRDYECLFEGRLTRRIAPITVGMPEGMRIATEAAPSMKVGYTSIYQGVFAFREDNSAILDLSTTSSEPSEPLNRNIYSAFRQKGSRRILVPDRGGLVGPDTTQKVGLSFINNQQSMLRIDANPYLQYVLRHRDNLEYLGAAWDVVEGSRCLAFSLTQRIKGGSSGLVERFWVDLTRGAVVLKYESFDDGVVGLNLSDVKLVEVPTEDGKTVWFPASGKMRWYDMVARTRDTRLEATFDVLAGSLKINQGLKDDRFSLDYGLDAKTRELAREFNSGRRQRPNQGPVAAAKALAEVIKDVDDPSKRLTARTSPANWFSRYGLGISLVGFGVIVLVSTVVLRNRVR